MKLPPVDIVMVWDACTVTRPVPFSSPHPNGAALNAMEWVASIAVSPAGINPRVNMTDIF
jgi:hypothetical protein